MAARKGSHTGSLAKGFIDGLLASLKYGMYAQHYAAMDEWYKWKMGQGNPNSEIFGGGHDQPLGGIGGGWGGGGSGKVGGDFNTEQMLDAAKKAGFSGDDVAHIVAIAQAESGGRLGAVGSAGELGLTQINPHAWGQGMAESAGKSLQGSFDAAYTVYKKQGWGAWSTDPTSPNFTPNNSMGRFLGTTRTALHNIERGVTKPGDTEIAKDKPETTPVTDKTTPAPAAKPGQQAQADTGGSYRVAGPAIALSPEEAARSEADLAAHRAPIDRSLTEGLGPEWGTPASKPAGERQQERADARSGAIATEQSMAADRSAPPEYGRPMTPPFPYGPSDVQPPAKFPYGPSDVQPPAKFPYGPSDVQPPAKFPYGPSDVQPQQGPAIPPHAIATTNLDPRATPYDAPPQQGPPITPRTIDTTNFDPRTTPYDVPKGKVTHKGKSDADKPSKDAQPAAATTKAKPAIPAQPGGGSPFTTLQYDVPGSPGASGAAGGVGRQGTLRTPIITALDFSKFKGPGGLWGSTTPNQPAQPAQAAPVAAAAPAPTPRPQPHVAARPAPTPTPPPAAPAPAPSDPYPPRGSGRPGDPDFGHQFAGGPDDDMGARMSPDEMAYANEDQVLPAVAKGGAIPSRPMLRFQAGGATPAANAPQLMSAGSFMKLYGDAMKQANVNPLTGQAADQNAFDQAHYYQRMAQSFSPQAVSGPAGSGRGYQATGNVTPPSTMYWTNPFAPAPAAAAPAAAAPAADAPAAAAAAPPAPAVTNTVSSGEVPGTGMTPTAAQLAADPTIWAADTTTTGTTTGAYKLPDTVAPSTSWDQPGNVGGDIANYDLTGSQSKKGSTYNVGADATTSQILSRRGGPIRRYQDGGGVADPGASPMGMPPGMGGQQQIPPIYYNPATYAAAGAPVGKGVTSTSAPVYTGAAIPTLPMMRGGAVGFADGGEAEPDPDTSADDMAIQREIDSGDAAQGAPQDDQGMQVASASLGGFGGGMRLPSPRMGGGPRIPGPGAGGGAKSGGDWTAPYVASERGDQGAQPHPAMNPDLPPHTPQLSDENGNPSPSLVSMIGNGLHWLAERLGLAPGPQQGGAIASDPNIQSAQRNFAQGNLPDGTPGMTDEQWEQKNEIVDPHHKLAPELHNIAGMEALYNSALLQGNASKAGQLAAMMLQKSVMVSQSLSKEAAQAIMNRDLKSGLDLLKEAKAAIADGTLADAKISPDGQSVIVSGHNLNGDELWRQVVAPKDILAAAVQGASGRAGWDRYEEAAGKFSPEYRQQQEARKAHAKDAAAAADAEAAGGIFTPDQPGAGGAGGGGGGGGFSAPPGPQVTPVGNQPAAPAPTPVSAPASAPQQTQPSPTTSAQAGPAPASQPSSDNTGAAPSATAPPGRDRVGQATPSTVQPAIPSGPGPSSDQPAPQAQDVDAQITRARAQIEADVRANYFPQGGGIRMDGGTYQFPVGAKPNSPAMVRYNDARRRAADAAKQEITARTADLNAQAVEMHRHQNVSDEQARFERGQTALQARKEQADTVAEGRLRERTDIQSQRDINLEGLKSQLQNSTRVFNDNQAGTAPRGDQDEVLKNYNPYTGIAQAFNPDLQLANDAAKDHSTALNDLTKQGFDRNTINVLANASFAAVKHTTNSTPEEVNAGIQALVGGQHFDAQPEHPDEQGRALPLHGVARFDVSVVDNTGNIITFRIPAHDLGNLVNLRAQQSGKWLGKEIGMDQTPKPDWRLPPNWGQGLPPGPQMGPGEVVGP